MTALNEIVLALCAPLLLMFFLLALFVRRHGALHWVGAIVVGWAAGVVDAASDPFQPLAVGLGSLGTVLLFTGAHAYSGRTLSARGWLAALSLPIVQLATTALAGPMWGYAAMAASDACLMAAAAWLTWPRGELETLRTARALPIAFLAFILPDLYYQISRSQGAGPEWPTFVIATGLISLAAVLLLVLTARMVRDETELRHRVEARLSEREGELEESLVRTRSAERLAAVGTLAAGIAHQINNPVGAILAAAQFELSEPTGSRSGEASVRATLETIEREALRCTRILRNVLLFARTDPGRVADHDLRAIVESARAATADSARRRGADVAIEGDSGPIVVRGNAVELEQIFVNLIRNGVESRPAGARVRIRLEASGGDAVVDVRDNGTGIDDDLRQRIFEPFYTTKLREGGSGLGLAVVHGILTTHRGTIELVPIAGPGTCFRIRLPLSPAGSVQPSSLNSLAGR